MAPDLTSLLAQFSGEPILLGLALFAATFVAEDLATIAAGIIVARTGADPAAAVAGVMLGTATGDLALYWFGRWGANTRYGNKLRARDDVRRAEAWITGRVIPLTFAARFLPGFRLPIFAASGLVAAPLTTIGAIIAFTTPLWTSALFTISFAAGQARAEHFLSAALPLGLLVSVGGLVMHRASNPRSTSSNLS
jgi:membrane protein DedA with SNARE-associated domain